MATFRPVVWNLRDTCAKIIVFSYFYIKKVSYFYIKKDKLFA